jgi:hypothetical protein
MYKLKRIITAIAALVSGANPLFGFAQNGTAIYEIPDLKLSDIAIVSSVDGVGTVIYYNPVLCTKAGAELCQFFRMHEYGHIAMGHLSNSNPDQETRKREEAEADRWAAQNAASHAVRAAYRHFQAGGGETPVHGAGKARAARVALYAGIQKYARAHYPDRKAGAPGIAAQSSRARTRAAGLGKGDSYRLRSGF